MVSKVLPVSTKNEIKNHLIFIYFDPFILFVLMYDQIIFLVSQLTEKYLPSDIKNLIFNNYFILDVNNKIEERLKDVFNNNLPNFKLLMKETGCFISGSFITQCILGECWNNSDIDIYVPTTKNQNIHLCLKLDDFLIDDMGIENGYAERYPYEIHEGLRWIRNYEGCGKECCVYCDDGGYSFGCPRNRKIQIIGIEMEKGFDKAIEFVEEAFDFDVCKSLYHLDGVYIKYLKEVITKTTNFKSCKLLWPSFQRYYKYTKRGFSFKNVESGEVSIPIESEESYSDES